MADDSQISPGITRKLVGFLVDTPASAIPPSTGHFAKRVLLDTIGVSLAAAHRPIGNILSGYVREAGQGAAATSTVIGCGFKTTAPLAAMVNGSLSNSMDYDEGFHVATHTVPALLALAERTGASGRDVLDALVIGYEAGAKFTRLIDAKRKQQRGPTHRGWWHVGLVGPIAAAFTCSRLLKLDQHATAMAIGIATCSSGGFRRNMGTMAKGLHSGHGARDGIEAVLLAQRGFKSDPEVIEAPLGFLHAVVDPEDRELSAVMEFLGNPYELEKAPGVKDIPACTPAHAMINTTVAAVKKGGRSHWEIDMVEADLHTFSLNRAVPTDEDSAGFCGAFLVAAALVHGRVGLEQVSDEAVAEPAIKAMMQRIRHTPTATKGVERVKIRYRDGTEVVAEGTNRPNRLVTDEAVSAKFRECASPLLGTSELDCIEEQIAALEHQPNISRLMAAAMGRA